jgi:hypothetical protein
MKYEHLIKPLSIGAINRVKPKNQPGAFLTKLGYTDQLVWLNGKDLEWLNLNFSYGFHTKPGDWHGGLDPHVHPYPEVYFFVGLDTANINQLGAEIECCLGKEQETYTFAESTVIVVPAGLPHGPFVTKRIYSPKGFGCYTAGLNARPETDYMGEAAAKMSAAQWQKIMPAGRGKVAAGEKILKNKPVKATGKYAHLLKTLNKFMLTERGKLNTARFTPEELAKRAAASKKSGFRLGPGNADHLAWMYGRDLEGLKVNMDWGFYSKPGLWHRGVGAHVHTADEVLVFAGADPSDINYLGAEIEIDLGKEHERYVINKPSVVICPAGLPHCPIITRWIDKPHAFFSINLSGESESTYID